jgi:hypothetical protein
MITNGSPRVLALRLRNPSDMGLFQWNYLLIAGSLPRRILLFSGFVSAQKCNFIKSYIESRECKLQLDGSKGPFTLGVRDSSVESLNTILVI